MNNAELALRISSYLLSMHCTDSPDICIRRCSRSRDKVSQARLDILVSAARLNIDVYAVTPTLDSFHVRSRLALAT